MFNYRKKLFTTLLIMSGLFNAFALAIVPNAPGLYIGVTDINETAVRINFKDNSNNENGFKIFGDINLSLPANDETTTPSVHATVTNLTCDRMYQLEAVAYNNDGNSTSSNSRSFNIHTTFGITCPDNEVPDAPGGYIGVTDINKTAVRINFKDNSDNETGFRVFGSNIDVSISANNEAEHPQAYATLTDLSCNRTYEIQALAYNNNGNSIVTDKKSFNIHTTFDVRCDSNNTAPIADAGANQTVTPNTVVQLDGSASSDTDGDSLTYQWSIESKPNGSNATLSDATLVDPTFIADVNGTYKLQLIVNDGEEDSVADVVQITIPINDGENYGTVTGIVRDTDTNNILSNVSLRIGQTTVQSNEQGYFTFSNVAPAEPAIIQIVKTGFVEVSERIVVHVGMNSDINVYLRQEGTAQIRESSNDMNLTQDNFEIHIPANGLVDENGQPFNGQASIHMTPFDPTTSTGIRAFPGDFVGVRANGTEGPLLSFGFIDVNIVDNNGNKLNLAPGINAFMRIPIPATLQASAPATTTLWWFNPVDAQWHDEGTLTKNANYYEGDVPHFSIWNADYLYQSSFIDGRLIHCETDEPVRCGEIIVEGNGWSSRAPCTDDDGIFEGLPVMPNTNTGVYGRKNGIRGDLYPFTTLNVGQTYDVGDICIDSPVAKITLTWEDQPQDLDAHLTFENDNGDREMIYYAHKNANDQSMNLDTDDTNGWGPEIVTISTWKDGTYRYAVHHYSGSSDISNSGAVLNMIIDREGDGNTAIFSLIPSAGAQGNKDVWSAWDIDIQNGQVADIHVIDDYIHGISANNIDAFSPSIP